MVPKMFNALIILNAVFLATTYQIESFGCMAIICSPPKICKVIDEIAQCVLQNSSISPPVSAKMPPPADRIFYPAPLFCDLPPLTGQCSKSRILWFYNSEIGRCERFTYSGCGNRNRFFSRTQCERTCQRV
ncbi:unnamed protein product [Dracunculus medinensis]|uniref:BPTI/Kunitz inhibitor domain-containing protein n=1 Tax=Dracunculus medinensis TaxID=318479 RepID=A0A0N4U8V5_DRAME|nr:unnamed protein product [Dracunculus medinensis]